MSKEAAISMLSGVAPAAIPSNSDATGAPQPSEAPVQGTEAPKPELESSRFAKLAEKESKIVKERQELQAEKEKLGAIKKQIEDFEAKRKTDPVGALKDLGFSETDIFNYLADSSPKELSPEEKASAAAREEIAKWEEKQASERSVEDKKRNDTIIARFREDITKTVAAEAEKFEYINYEGEQAHELIYDTVAEVLKVEGRIIPIAEAAQMVEEYYEEQDRLRSQLKKRQPKVEAAPEPIQEPKPTPRGPQTLTNRATASVASVVNKQESLSQKKERLMESLRQGRLLK